MYSLNIKIHRSNYEKKKPFEKTEKEMKTDSIIWGKKPNVVFSRQKVFTAINFLIAAILRYSPVLSRVFCSTAPHWDFLTQFLSDFQILYWIWNPLPINSYNWQGSQKNRKCMRSLILYYCCADTQQYLDKSPRIVNNSTFVCRFLHFVFIFFHIRLDIT